MKQVKLINPTKEHLTVEKLRTFKGYEIVSDAEAEEIVNSIKEFAALAYDYYKQKTDNKNISSHDT